MKEAAKEKEVDLTQKVDLSVADILALITKIQSDQAKAMTDAGEKNAEVLASSLEKLSPHYRNPGQLENEKSLRDGSRKVELDKIRNMKKLQYNCPHLLDNGRSQSGAFFGLKLFTGEVIGICCYCRKTISSLNPKHEKYWKKVSGTIGEAGQLSGLSDAVEVGLQRLTGDELDRVRKNRAEMVRTESVREDALFDD
jgi:hypothetical protein